MIENDRNNLPINNDELYVTDDSNFISSCIEKRLKKYNSDTLTEQWKEANITLKKSDRGYETLYICGQEVMSNLQIPYMKKLAENACLNGGKVLNIGYGLGISDSFIEKNRELNGVTEHHIIEFNKQVCKKAEAWRKTQKYKKNIFIHQGPWETIVPMLSMQFDGVLYDGYPLHKDMICKDVIPFIEASVQYKLVKENEGVMTFFMDSIDGFGEAFKKFLKEYRITIYSTEKVTFPFDPNADVLQYKSFIAPLLRGFKYHD
ncbi:hypothetical protein AB835_09200 [Candidatus Endobugula sertula]|uniref:Uncharacterized protein n=1 Tax=Candidatus Endobugula sertula TaxID=62101 RepID=A0A1D2QP72_9GAMM|nr:hypothetical protein AB835_09200 [Candidatus Endobugula sertula]